MTQSDPERTVSGKGLSEEFGLSKPGPAVIDR